MVIAVCDVGVLPSKKALLRNICNMISGQISKRVVKINRIQE